MTIRQDYYKFVTVEWDRMAGCHAITDEVQAGSPDELILAIAEPLIPLGDGPRRLEYLIAMLERYRDKAVEEFARKLTK